MIIHLLYTQKIVCDTRNFVCHVKHIEDTEDRNIIKKIGHFTVVYSVSCL